LGNQVGKGETAAATVGGTAATLLGVAGGALGGHYAEKALSSSKGWNVAVQMDNGATRTVTLQSEPKVRPGERVRVSEGGVVRYKADHEGEKDEKSEKND